MDSIAVIKSMVSEAEDHAEYLGEARIRAMEYYRGEMKDVPADANRSSIVTRDVRAYIKKVLPSVVRTILGRSEVVEFLPVGENDEDGAQQSTDYLNHVVMPETDGEQAIYDAVHDALLLRNGILKWWWEDRQEVSISRHSGLDETALAELVADDEISVLEHTEYEEQAELGPVMLHDVKIRRSYRLRQARVAAVPRENFLIHPDAVSLDDSLLTGEVTQVRRSDLVAMGYDQQVVDNLPLSSEDDAEEQTRRNDYLSKSEEQRANEPVNYYDLYVRVDMDGDGVAELRHMVFAGAVQKRGLLVDEECDDVQFADLSVMRQPHQWEGISVFDDVEDVMKVKTVLLRQTLDNLYYQNNPTPIMQEGAVTNPGVVYNPEFGKPIKTRQGVDVRTALTFNQVPFVAQQSFGMLDYMDKEGTERTGISDASSGMAPDALQNMTAKASSMIEAAGIGQTEMMVRTVAMGLRRFFRGLHRLIIRHQDQPRTIRLRDEWVTFDPRHWNAEMDCVVNVGLGAGTRERDMMMMQQVLALQEKLLAAFGPNNPYVKPENLWNSISRLVESAGLKDPAMYFTEPDPQEIQQMMQQAAQKPDPAMEKVKAQAALEDKKAQTQVMREKAQLEADMTTKRADLEAEQIKQMKELSWEREKFMMQQRLELTKLGLAMNENGEPINPDAEALRQMLTQTQAMLQAVGSQASKMNQPRRIIRDEYGEIAGYQVGDEEMAAVRDGAGEIVGFEPRLN